MFLKKSLLFTTALALLLFAGQASAQGVSLSLSHVPGDDGTENMVSGPAVRPLQSGFPKQVLMVILCLPMRVVWKFTLDLIQIL